MEKFFFSKNKLEKCSIQNIKINNFDYKIYKIKNRRVFTNYVENLAVISNNSIIKDVSFQQIKGKLFKSKNQVSKTGTPKFLKNFLEVHYFNSRIKWAFQLCSLAI